MHPVDQSRAQQGGGEPSPAFDQTLVHAKPAQFVPGGREIEVRAALAHRDHARTGTLEANPPTCSFAAPSAACGPRDTPMPYCSPSGLKWAT